jgi:hypothetical protein
MNRIVYWSCKTVSGSRNESDRLFFNEYPFQHKEGIDTMFPALQYSCKSWDFKRHTDGKIEIYIWANYNIQLYYNLTINMNEIYSDIHQKQYYNNYIYYYK